MKSSLSGGLKHRHRYDATFKDETVRKFLDSGLAVSVFARNEGIEQSILHRWVKRHRETSAGTNALEDAVECDLAGKIRSLQNEIAAVRRSVGTLRTIMEKAFKDKYPMNFSSERAE